MLPQIVSKTYAGSSGYFEIKAFERDAKGELRVVTKTVQFSFLKRMLKKLIKNEYVLNYIADGIGHEFNGSEIYTYTHVDGQFMRDRFMAAPDPEKVENLFKALQSWMSGWHPRMSKGPGPLEKLIFFLLKQWFGLKSPTVFGQYFLRPSTETNDSRPLDPTESTSSTLPFDVLGLIFSNVSSPGKAMSLNMTTKGGVVKYPDYYKYIELFPYHVFKFALDDLIKARMEKDVSLYLTIMQRALYTDLDVFHIWADHIVANKDIDDSLFKRITEMIMFECQFSQTMSSVADRAWSGGRREYTRSLYERGIIDEETFNKAAVDYDYVKPDDIPPSYDRLVGNMDEVYRVFGTARGYSYDFLKAISTGDFQIGHFLSDGVNPMLSAARKGYIKTKIENKTEKKPFMSESDRYIDRSNFTTEMNSLLKLRGLSSEQRRPIHSFMVRSPIRDYILLDIPIEDTVDNNNVFTCFAILQLGLDPRLYPSRFSALHNAADSLIRTWPLREFVNVPHMNVHDNVYYQLNWDRSKINTFYRWGDMFYQSDILDDRDVGYYHRVRFLNSIAPGSSFDLMNKYMNSIFYGPVPRDLTILEEYKKYVMREIAYATQTKNPQLYELRYGLPSYLLPRIGDVD